MDNDDRAESRSVSLGALIGSVVTNAGNTAFPDVMDNRGWRVPLYVGLATPTVSLVLELLTLVESPYWCMLKGKREQATAGVRKLYPRKTEPEVQAEIDLLQYTIEKEREQATTVSDPQAEANRYAY